MAKDQAAAQWPARLLTNGNRDLARDGIWTWSLPALAARLPDGHSIRTCQQAGVCALACYAREGTYKIPTVRDRHIRNLLYTVEDLGGWRDAMIRELAHQRFDGARVRIHDGGDFYSPEYLDAWLTVMAASPHVGFYTYTKEVRLFRDQVEPAPPPNFKWVYSLGGKQDALLVPGVDRVADVFPTEPSIARARFHSQLKSDLLAVDGPSPVGMAANRIPKLQRRQGDRTFGQWQAETDRRTYQFAAWPDRPRLPPP